MAKTDNGRPLDVQDRDLDRVKHTAWGTRLATIASLGLPISIEENTTLNEKFNINKAGKFTERDRLITGFYCIGNKGHRSITTSFDVHVTQAVEHDPLDAALFNHLPFVLRRPNQDLSPEERENYRLRRKESHNGLDYIAYYAKKFTVEKLVRVLVDTTNKGVTTTEEYRATQTNLAPKMPAINQRQVIKTSNSKVHVSAGAKIIFNEDDVDELMNVCKIIYGDANHAIISEIGLVVAVDDPSFVSPIDGQRHAELKGATIATFISSRHDLLFNTDGFVENLELGEKIPLITYSTHSPTIGNPIVTA